ncbi:hypothetical protein FDG2_4028 [Candidatus Protofrankia californiensis]|uniref:Uncharacterized protein n=1 Tax=Candidatus Protofrankia californiensis TaxID=1839754 RepID=A0A1C3P324_9ACTN|nr:hypothetical protein FDG2_4028 [Candidatus Protofrankia californiensis]
MLANAQLRGYGVHPTPPTHRTGHSSVHDTFVLREDCDYQSKSTRLSLATSDYHYHYVIPLPAW